MVTTEHSACPVGSLSPLCDRSGYLKLRLLSPTKVLAILHLAMPFTHQPPSRSVHEAISIITHAWHFCLIITPPTAPGGLGHEEGGGKTLLSGAKDLPRDLAA